MNTFNLFDIILLYPERDPTLEKGTSGDLVLCCKIMLSIFRIYAMLKMKASEAITAFLGPWYRSHSKTTEFLTNASQ